MVASNLSLENQLVEDCVTRRYTTILCNGFSGPCLAIIPSKLNILMSKIASAGGTPASM